MKRQEIKELNEQLKLILLNHGINSYGRYLIYKSIPNNLFKKRIIETIKNDYNKDRTYLVLTKSRNGKFEYVGMEKQFNARCLCCFKLCEKLGE